MSLPSDALSAGVAGSYAEMNGMTQSGRAVYQQEGGSLYLFWLSGHWAVGSDYASLTVYLYSTDSAQCPEAADSTWYYADTAAAWQTGGVDVSCPALQRCPTLRSDLCGALTHGEKLYGGERLERPDGTALCFESAAYGGDVLELSASGVVCLTEARIPD